MLYGAERLRRRAPAVVEGERDGDTRIAETAGYRDAAAIGAAQALALIPGFSRSGATMGGGLLVGPLQRGRRPLLVPAGDAHHRRRRGAEAARAVRLDRRRRPRPGAGGALCSAFTAYLSVRFLMRYFETNRLTPFAIYCVVAGLLSSIYLGWFS